MTNALTRDWFRLFQIHEATTMKRIGWLGISNGELLAKAELEFQAFVTVDKNIPHEQNLKDSRIIIAILRVQDLRFTSIEPLISRCELALSAATPGQIITITNS